VAGVLLALLPATSSAEPNIETSPKRQPDVEINGYLVIVGGGGLPDTVRDRFLELAKNKKGQRKLVVIPTASELVDKFPDRYRSRSYDYWNKQGLDSVALMHTTKKAEANDPKFVAPLKDATAAWLGGGDQSRLVNIYGDTAVERELRSLLNRGGVIGGTSAGASVMSRIMITGGHSEARVGTGFGLLPHVVIDQHFGNRQREPRLKYVVSKYPNCLGLGIDEQTAVIVHGHTFTVLGDAHVAVCMPPVDNDKLPSMKLYKAGDAGDLLMLTHSALSRLKTASEDKPMVVKEGSTMP
jgi:cyanophycinase